MKKINSFFKNKQAFSLSANKLVSLILLVIVIIVLLTFSSRVGETGTSAVESMLSPMQEARCQSGFFQPPINCDLYANICSDEERQTWDEISTKFLTYNCEDKEEGCSCVETRILEELEKSQFDLIFSEITIPALSIQNRFELINDKIRKIEVEIRGRDTLNFEYSNNQWRDTSTGYTDFLNDFANKLNGETSIYTGLAYISQEYKKENSGIEHIRIEISADYKNFQNIILLYRVNYNLIDYYTSDNERFSLRKRENEENYSLSSNTGRFENFELKEYNCNKIILENKDTGEILEFSNFDIMCGRSFSIGDFTELNLEALDSFPSEIKQTMNKLIELELRNGKNALEYLFEYSKLHDLNPILPLTVLVQESRGDPLALSPTGAAGLTQFIPNTAREYGLQVPRYTQSEMNCLRRDGSVFYTGTLSQCNTCMTAQNTFPFNRCLYNNVEQRVLYSSVDERFNPEKAIEAGVEYLKSLSSSYDGNLILILTAYNAGPGVSNICKGLSSDSQTIECIRRTISTISAYENNYKNKIIEVETYLRKITTNIQDITEAQDSSNIS